jgi:hypothetical protein
MDVMEGATSVAMTEAETATYLTMAQKTLAKWRVTGDGPVFQKFGKAIRYDRDDVDRWRATRKRRSTSDSGGAVVR